MDTITKGVRNSIAKAANAMVRGGSPVLYQQVYRAVQKRMSWRGIERVFGLSRRMVQRWVEQWIVCMPKLATSLSLASVDDVLELDELWSSVGSKSEARWLWVAL